MVEVTQADIDAAHAWIRQQSTGLQMMMNKPRGLHEAFARHRAAAFAAGEEASALAMRERAAERAGWDGCCGNDIRALPVKETNDGQG